MQEGEVRSVDIDVEGGILSEIDVAPSVDKPVSTPPEFARIPATNSHFCQSD